MPPLPSTLDAQTASLISQLERKQKDIADFQIPRLRVCTGPLATQQQLAAELKEDIDSFARSVEILDVAVDDQPSERNRRELRSRVDEFQKALASTRKDMRAAMLASKKAIDAKQFSNRAELLRSAAVKERQTLGEKVAEDALMKANNDVTEALQRTMTRMQDELERSVLSVQLLESSTASLSSASNTHDTLSNFLSTSKHLITALEKSDWLDRMLILAGLGFFLLVVAFILKQRLVDRSLRIAFFWTRFLPSGSLVGGGKTEVLRSTEEGLLSAMSLAAASVTAATASAPSLLASLLSSSDGYTSAIPEDSSSSLESIYTTTTAASSDPTPSYQGTPEIVPQDGVSDVHDEL